LLFVGGMFVAAGKRKPQRVRVPVRARVRND